MRFFRIYKNNLLLKLYNHNSILAYKPKNITAGNKLGNEGKIEVRKFNDTCGFEKLYLVQSKREEIFLNFKEKLFIAMKAFVFLYDYKNNTMVKMDRLIEEHKGGSFIYVPFNTSIYCISGLMSVLVERLDINKSLDVTKSKWISVNKLNFPRAYYSSFVQNDCKIYIVLGFNMWDNEFLTTIEKFDTSDPNGKWLMVKLNTKKIPKISFSACVPTSDEELFIMGGKTDANIDNSIIYRFDIKTGMIEDSNMRLPLPEHMDTTHEAHEAKNLFYQENSFVAVRQEDDDYDGAFLLGLFDSKNYLHLVNIKNFDYLFVSHDIFNYEMDNSLEDESEDQIN